MPINSDKYPKLRTVSAQGERTPKRHGYQGFRPPRRCPQRARLKIVVSRFESGSRHSLKSLQIGRFGLFGGPRKRMNSGTRTVTPHNDRMVAALICISAHSVCP